MLEGVVHQVLLGYLGRYVKDFSRDQVKVTLWNIEVELKDIDLILEAFDYLQLPFALKQGRVGRLSIKVPWNLIGGEPILIALENVFFSVSPRDDHEWRMDAIETRELAGKKAKLAAAELAKLSRRVCDNKGGWSFIPFVTTKVLENIQVSIRNFHLLYSDMQSNSEQVIFGLRFSSLTMLKQNPVGLRMGQVSKILEVEGLEIYCSISKDAASVLSLSKAEDSEPWFNSHFVGDKSEHMLEPVNVSLSLLVNRSGKLNDLPQYSISAKITCLVVSLNEIQLQQILVLSDYLYISQLREKYGRYRPWSCRLSRKEDGWQRLWWRYAQESILSDVREKLKKTSWRYLGQRLSNRRKYVNLYKTKLEFLRQDLPIDESVIRDLEQMEKESDIDDILSYRSAAEHELQEVLSKSSTVNFSIEKSRQDGQSSGKSRGWLNWLSRGMLGAGGTDDSSQFSGVVSDEDVQDIYEATRFYPPVLTGVDADTNDRIYTRVIDFSIDEISATIRSMNLCQAIAKLNLHDVVIKCNLQEELVTVLAFVKSGEMVNASNEQVIRLMSCMEKNVVEDLPLCRVQAELSPKRDVELSVNVMLQSLEVAYETTFFRDFIEFFTVIKYFEFQHERVLSSLNGIEDVKSRLLAKAECILSSHKKMSWDVSITNITISVPSGNAVSEEFNMVFDLGSLVFASRTELDTLSSSIDGQSFIQKNLVDSSSTSDWLTSFQLQDLYNHFETKLVDFEVKLVKPNYPHAISIVKKFCASITFASCIIPDESRLKQLEVYVAVGSLDANFSQSIYESVVALIVLLNGQCSRSEPIMLENPNSLHNASSHPGASHFGFSLTANIKSVNFLVDLGNDGENSSSITFGLKNLDVWYSLLEYERCWVGLEAMEVTANTLDGEHVLCSFKDLYPSNNANWDGMAITLGSASDNLCDKNKSTKACFLLYYEALGNRDFASHKFTVYLNDVDLHCYPYIFGLLVGFYDRICSSSPFTGAENSFGCTSEAKSTKNMPGFQFQRFGFSNYSEIGSSDHASISLDCFPFVTIHNSGSISSLESSLRFSVPDWRRLLNLRENKLRSPNCSLKKGSNPFHTSQLKSTMGMVALPVSGSFDANLYAIDINLSGVTLHFHDSSCIVGTIMLPTSKSSLSIYGDCMDLVSSSEGVILTSSWWTNNLHDFLWGPSSPNLSPILNIRVKKVSSGSLSSQLEVSFGIQHTCCVLPFHYLAIIIGYFSLHDWSSNSSVQPVSKSIEYMGGQIESAIIYKFEVLDSTLVLPIESDDHQFLKTDIQQLYGSFINDCALSDVLKDIPPEYVVPENKVARTNNCLNIFGRDLSLSLLLFEDDCLTLTPGTKPINFPLIAPFSADVWIRIPSELQSLSTKSSGSTCIMSRIGVCQVFIDDFYLIGGFEALLEIIDQFSFVQDESKSYTSDVLQFLQSRRLRKENGAVSLVDSSITFSEVRCHVESLAIQLNRLGKGLLEPVAKAEMNFICSMSVINGKPINLDLSFFSLALCSLPNSVMLARCSDTCSTSSVLDLSFSKFDPCQSDVYICLPSLDIWLQCSDWTEVLDLLESYGKKLAKTAKLDSLSRSSAVNMIRPVHNISAPVPEISDKRSGASANNVPPSMMQETVVLLLRSENIGIRVYFPLHVIDEAFTEEGLQNVSSTGIDRSCKLLTCMTHGKSSELIISGKNVKFKCILEKTSGAVGFQGDEYVNSWPLFEIFQVNVDTEICNIQEKPVHANLGFQCDQLDLWLSHQIFFFLHDVKFDVPGSRSQFNFGSMEFKIQLRKGSLMLSDGRWSCSGPLLEVLLKNLLFRANMTQNSMESAAACDIQVNYNNIHKVFWEPFLEPWKFEMEIIRKQELNALLDNTFITDVHLVSTGQLNFNITEPLIETVLRTIEMVKDAWGFSEHDPSEKQRFLDSQLTENISEGRYAPYILQNLTSSPLEYHVYQGLADSDQFDITKEKDGKIVQAGASVPIYLNDIPVQQLFHYGPSHSSDNLSERQSNGVAHHLMTIQFDGMSVPSAPVSMDLVGLTYFEVDFSNNSQYNVNLKENGAASAKNGFVVPVVFDVSMQRYSKLIRLYSTVIILNATSIPLELRFDIPFGISPKILDPVYPGQEFPLPLHLAEAGRMRWRPLGNSYLWSEVHNLSDLLSLEGKIGFLRSFVCYPSHPSSDPFRCCLSLQHISIPAADRLKKGSVSHVDDTLNQSIQSSNKNIKCLDKSKHRYIHQMTLSAPLVINNYLPEAISLTIESGGITRSALLSKVVTLFHHIDLSHDLTVEFNIHGYRPSVIKFPRTETFSTTAKFSGTKFCQSETVVFDPDICNGPIYVTVEKMMDAFSGARELFIFVPFLLYNCTAFPLNITEFTNEMDRTVCTLPSCYNKVDNELFQGTRDGLSLLLSDQHSSVGASQIDSLDCSFLKDCIGSTTKTFDLQLGRFVRNPLITSSQKQTDQHDLVDQKTSSNILKNRLGSSTQLSGNNDFVEKEYGMVKACIYSPRPISAGREIVVCIGNCLRRHNSENMPNSSWSGPFLLVPPSGSTTVLVPQPSSNAMFILSVTSNAIAGAFAGRTRAITFQPRYVISNACSKDLYYKQKGTDAVYHLGVRQHSQLHWTDTARELLISMRFDEPGWQWSGSFLPDHLGDTQVKIRNYASGTMKMIRVEVQNADVSIRDEKIGGSLQGNSGTNLILLSEDDTGYMPYRIDNFSKERLRIYQQRCESLDTIVHPYTSCPYAWDEPCYPHRVFIEVPGERMVGSFALDDLKEYTPVHLQSTSEKPERMLLLSVRAEGATKVLSIIDSNYHVLKDMKDQSTIRFKEKQKQEKQKKSVDYKEKFSLTIPCIGISLVNSYPQELLFASAKNIKIDLLQSVDHQKLSCHISSLQIDNQLHNTPYPVVLSFNSEYRSNQIGQIMNDDSPTSKVERGILISSDSSFEPVFYLAVAKWRKKDVSLVSFEYISLRMADFCLELEQELILSLLYFFKAVSPGFQSQVLPFSDPIFSVGFMHGQTSEHVKVREQLHGIGTPVLSKVDETGGLLPLIVPIGSPWQQIHRLARRQRKIYVESFHLAPIKFSFSFSSSPWMLRNGVLTSGESLIHRGLMALADVEGARIHLKELSIMHQMASWESIQEILIRHYTRQLLHEMYKVFGSAGVIGNPMGFARSLGVGIRDFLAVPAKSIWKSPTGIITGMAQGTTSLLSNTVYALSDAATQFSKAAHKGIVAFTFDDQAVARMEKQLKGEASHSKGIINEVFEGLTGLLQSPVKEAEKHGLPGILSGIALGVTGLVGRPAASILEVTGKTAQSIRNRSRLYHMGSHRSRVRLPRPLSSELPLRPYSWEEAVGISVLKEADDGKLKDEVYVMSKALKKPGKFVIMTDRLVLVVNCPSLVDLGKPEFQGVAVNQEWIIETEISLHSVIHTDADDGMVHIVGSSSDALLRQNQQLSRKGGSGGTRMRWNNPSMPLPLFQTNLEMASEEDAENILQVLLSTIEQGKEQRGNEHLLQRSNIK